MLVYFDTNIYEMISGNGDAVAVRRMLDGTGAKAVVSGTNVLETLRAPNEIRIARFRTISTVAAEYESRPAAYLHAWELVGEAMRLRPKWLLHRPDSAQGPKWFATHQRIWSEIRRDPSYEPDGLASNQTFIERGAGFVLGEQREIRQTILSGNSLDMRLTDPELDRLARRLSDWDRWWRTSTAAIWESALLKNSPYSKDYRDYASAYLDLRAIRSSDLFRFWLLEVATERLPRNYLQALVSWEQMNVKPTPGNALDQIHCDKLFDVDVMVTADQAMFKVVSASVARVKALPRPDRRGFRKMARIALVDRGSTDSAEQIGAAMARF